MSVSRLEKGTLGYVADLASKRETRELVAKELLAEMARRVTMVPGVV